MLSIIRGIVITSSSHRAFFLYFHHKEWVMQCNSRTDNNNQQFLYSRTGMISLRTNFAKFEPLAYTELFTDCVFCNCFWFYGISNKVIVIVVVNSNSNIK